MVVSAPESVKHVISCLNPAHSKLTQQPKCLRCHSVAINMTLSMLGAQICFQKNNLSAITLWTLCISRLEPMPIRSHAANTKTMQCWDKFGLVSQTISHRLTAYKIVGHFFGLSYQIMNISGNNQGENSFFRISNISLPSPHAHLRGGTQALKSYGHFSDLGVEIALSHRHVEFFG